MMDDQQEGNFWSHVIYHVYSRLVDQLHLCNFLKCWNLLQIINRVAGNMLTCLERDFLGSYAALTAIFFHTLFTVMAWAIAEEVAVSFSQWDPVNSC